MRDPVNHCMNKFILVTQVYHQKLHLQLNYDIVSNTHIGLHQGTFCDMLDEILFTTGENIVLVQSKGQILIQVK